MTASSTSPPADQRLLLLATGAAIAVVATAVAIAHRRRPSAPPSASPAERALHVVSPAQDIPVVHAPPPPSVVAVRDDRHRGVALLGPITIAVALVLSGIGAGFLGVAFAAQRRAPEPPMTHVEPAVAAGRDVEAWPSRPGTTADAPQATEQSRPAPSRTVTAVVLPRSLPVSIDIPAIDVLSDVNALGQAEDGTLQTPAPGPEYNEAAWYRYSPTPGSLGPSILLGHVDSAADGPSVFFRLGEVRAGDRVTVTRADDSVAVFRVDEVRRYAKNDFPTARVYGDIGHAGLRIVTCGGAFDNASGHYLDNVVVFASLLAPAGP